MAFSTVFHPGPFLWRSRWRAILLSTLGYGISLGCLVWVFTGVNWHELRLELAGAGVLWLIIGALWALAAQVWHAWRWNFLVRPVSRPRFGRTVQALFIGLFANEVLPLRPGELIRAYLLAGWSGIAFSVLVSSVALERLLDGFSLAVGFFATTSFVSLPSYLVAGVRLLAGFLLIAAVVLLVLLWKTRDGARLPRFLAGRLRHAIQGIRRMANARTLALSVAASVVQLVLHGLPYWALCQSCRLGLSVGAVLGVVIIVRTATIIPNAPGNAGLLQAACVLALGLFGIDKTRATAFAALLFLVVTLPLLIGGATVAALTGIRIRDLRRGAVALAAVDSPPLEGPAVSERYLK